MKYKVGDKVRIKSWEWYNNSNKNKNGHIQSYNEVLFNAGMTNYCGCHAEIIEVSRSTKGEELVRLDIDGGNWAWYDWMFEENISENETDYDYEQLKEIAIELIRANANPMAVAFLAKEIYKELKKK